MKIKSISKISLIAALFTAMSGILLAQAGETKSWSLNNTDQVEIHGVEVNPVTYKGQKALRIDHVPGEGGEASFAKLVDYEFTNGIIDLEIAGKPGENAGQGARGFVGLAFRISEDNSKFECFYLRPTNGRANDQLRRNHSSQYISFPDYPWHKLRQETPGKYESYVDLEPGMWTKVRIEVSGDKAKLFVHGSDQPCLIVNDLKHGPDLKGSIGLWVAVGTEAYFAKLSINNQ